MEIWKDVPGYNGSYQVSNMGRLKSFKRNEKILKLQFNQGYHVYGFCMNGIQHRMSIHRIVAELFIPKIEGKDIINHKNGIPTDNRSENLEWCTQSENAKHCIHVLGKNSGIFTKENHPRKKHGN